VSVDFSIFGDFMKTRDRILQTSLQLFNKSGERAISTNHIAAKLAISPGNLYYHFRNKADIVYELFLAYQQQVDYYLAAPGSQPLVLADLAWYLEAVFDGLWQYRFFHRDLESLLDADPRLRAGYGDFTGRCLSAINGIFSQLASGGIITPRPEPLRSAMALNVWLVITNWMAYLKTAHATEEPAVLTLAELKQGIYQVLTLELPHVTPEYREPVLALRETYRPGTFCQAAHPSS
jgi:AcrR family transcriptional regulator